MKFSLISSVYPHVSAYTKLFYTVFPKVSLSGFTKEVLSCS